jgi:hypothetical protein
MTQALLMLIGMGLASGAGDRLGVLPLLDLAGGCYLAAGMVATLLLRSRSSSNERPATAHVPQPAGRHEQHG